MLNWMSKRKWLAVVLVFCMVLTLLPTDFSWAKDGVNVTAEEDRIDDAVTLEGDDDNTSEEESQKETAQEQIIENVTGETEDVEEASFKSDNQQPEVIENSMNDLLRESSQNIFYGTGITMKDVVLSVVTPEGPVPVQDGDTIKTTDTLDYNLTFSIGDSFNVSADTKYTYQLPTGINVKASLDVPLTNSSNGTILGVAHIDSATGLITFEFYTENMRSNTNFGLEFGGGLSSSSSEKVHEEVVSFPTASGTWDYRVNVEQDGDEDEEPELTDISVSKSGTQIVNDPVYGKVIEWSINVNTGGRNPFAASIVDTLPVGLTYVDGSAMLTNDTWNNVGTVQVTKEGQKLTFDVNSNPNGNYSVLKFKTKYDSNSVFSTTIDNSTSEMINNTVTVTPTGESGKGTTGSVSLTPSVLSKTGTTDAANGEVIWTVVLNEEGLDIKGTTFTDEFGSGLDSLSDAEVNSIRSQLPSGFNVSKTAKGFQITAPSETYTGTISFTYKTKINDYTVDNYSNTATITDGKFNNYTKTAQAPKPALISKTGNGYLSVGQLLKWKIVINQDKLSLGDGVYFDENVLSGNSDHNANWPIEIVSITKQDGTVLTPDENGHYQLGNIDGETVTLDVVTKLTDNAITYLNTNKPGWTTVKNEVTLHWPTNQITATGENGFSYTPTDVMEKDGTINQSKGVIEWSLKMKGFDNLPEQKAEFTDTLPAGNVLVEDSVKIIFNDTWGTYNLAKDSDYTINGNTLKITIDKNNPNYGYLLDNTKYPWFSYKIVYQTKLDPSTPDILTKANTSKDYENNATVKVTFPDDNIVTETDKKKVTGKIGGILGKDKTYESGKQTVDWIVSVNEAGYDLSGISNPRIVDTLPSYFDYVSGSGKLYDGNGNPVSSDKYSITYINKVLMVKLPTDGGTASYKFNFTTRFNVYDSQLPSEVTNTVEFLGLGESVSVTSDKVENISFNYASGWSETNASIKVRKVDSATGNPLAGATISLMLGDTVLDTQISGTDGWVQFPISYDANATLTVEIKEDQAPSGYKLATTTIPVTIDNDTQWQGTESNKYLEVSFPNTPLVQSATFYIEKQDAADGTKKLSGAVYGVYSDISCTTQVGTMTTNDKGVAFYSVDCPQTGSDDYYVKEITSPEGYKLDSATVKKITVDANRTVSYEGSTVIVQDSNNNDVEAVVFTDEKAKAAITIIKKDASNNALLPNAKYGLYLDSACTNLIAEETTDSSGEAEWINLDLGKTYYYREISAPSGYEVDATIYSVTVGLATDREDQSVTVERTNEKQLGSIIVKKTDDSAAHNPLKDVEFTLYKWDDATSNFIPYQVGSTPYAVTTSEEGIAEFTNLPFDKYKIYETNGPGPKYEYSAMTTSGAGVAVEVDSKDPKNVSVINKIKKFNVELIKGETNVAALGGYTPLQGVTFGLYENGNGDSLIKTAVTDSAGKITFSNIEYGNYYVKEITPLPGYKTNDTKYEVTTTMIDDKYTANPNVVPTFTTAELQVSGVVLLTNYIKNEKENGMIAFYKYGRADGVADSPLSGVVFTLYDKDGFEVTTATSDSNGKVEFSGLAYGQYTIRETATAAGYIADGSTWTVNVDKDKDAAVYTIKSGETTGTEVLSVNSQDNSNTVINNKIPTDKVNYLSFYIMKKYTDINGDIQPLSGATFVFSKSVDNGNTWTDPVTVVSDDAGKVAIENYVIADDSTNTQYKLEETYAPAGYKLPEESERVRIYTYAQLTVADYGHTNYISDFVNPPSPDENFIRHQLGTDILNSQILGKITIKKKAAGTLGSVKDAKFTIYEADGTTVAKDAHNNVLADLTTDENGLIVVDDMPLGKYVIKETGIPKGYYIALEKTPQITLTDTNPEHEETFFNTPISISVNKLVEGTTTGLNNAELAVYDETGTVKIEGPWITNGSKKNLTYTNYEVGKTYTLRETKVPAGYKKASDVRFMVDRNGVLSIVGSEGYSSGNTVFMEDAPVTLSFTKNNESGSAGLPGALMQLLDSSDTVLYEFVSNGELQNIDCSMVVVPTSGYAYYSIREKSAPSGYEVAEDIQLALDTDGNWHKVNTGAVESSVTTSVTMTDALKQNLYFAKVSSLDSSVRVQGAVMKITDVDDSDKYIEWTTTSAAKKITVDNAYPAGSFALIIGHTYIFEELQAPDGYKVAEAITFKVEGNTTAPRMTIVSGDTSALYYDQQTIAMKDEPISVLLRKVSETDAIITGAYFDLYESVGTTDTLVKKDITTTPGEPTVTLTGTYLKAGSTYKLVETKAPSGYSRLETPVIFTITDDGKVKIGSDIVVGNLIKVVNNERAFYIEKIDASTGSQLAGVVFTISEKYGPEITRWTTAENEVKEFKYTTGDIEFNKRYILTEEVTVNGYTYAEEVEFYISSVDQLLHYGDNSVVTDNLLIVENQPYTISVDKYVMGTATYLAGAKLQITDYNGTVVESWITGDNTHVVDVSKIKTSKTAGEYMYTLTEVEAPELYAKAQPITFYVDKNGQVRTANNTVIANNTLAMYDEYLGIAISKQDVAGKEVPGAKLTITSSEDSTFTPITWISTSTPYNISRDLFKPGVTYTLTETAAPDGYAYAESIDFMIDADGNVYVGGQPVTDKTVVMVDKVLTLNLAKKVTGTDRYLKGANFGVFDVETGSRILTFTSEDGVTKVDAGKLKTSHGEDAVFYLIRELEAPVGYELAKDKYFYFDDKGALYVLNDEETLFELSGDNTITMYDAPSTTSSKKTGDTSPVRAIGMMFYLSLAGLGSIMAMRRKGKR